MSGDLSNTKAIIGYSYIPGVTSISNALLIDTVSATGNANKIYAVVTSTINKPSNCAWGIREVFWIHSKAIIIRITGCTTDEKPHQWVSIYTENSWRGWMESGTMM